MSMSIYETYPSISSGSVPLNDANSLKCSVEVRKSKRTSC